MQVAGLRAAHSGPMALAGNIIVNGFPFVCLCKSSQTRV